MTKIKEAKIIAIANQKGGVGKSTTTYNLAAIKASKGKRVLMIDLDPNSNLTTFCKMRPAPSPNITELLDDEKEVDIFECGYPVEASGLKKLFLIPSNKGLAKTHEDMSKMMSRETILKRAIEPLRTEFDYIFIDCPPEIGTPSSLPVNALVAADEVIIVTTAEEMATYSSVNELKIAINSVKSVLNNELSFIGIIVNRFRAREIRQKEVYNEYLKSETILGTVRNTNKVPDGVAEGLPVCLKHPDEKVTEDFISIAKKI